MVALRRPFAGLGLGRRVCVQPGVGVDGRFALVEHFVLALGGAVGWEVARARSGFALLLLLRGFPFALVLRLVLLLLPTPLIMQRDIVRLR